MVRWYGITLISRLCHGDVRHVACFLSSCTTAGHGSFFQHREPMTSLRRDYRHITLRVLRLGHATRSSWSSGDLDRRGTGDVWTLPTKSIIGMPLGETRLLPPCTATRSSFSWSPDGCDFVSLQPPADRQRLGSSRARSTASSIPT